MIKHKPGRRLFYPPGLITLTFLPLLLLSSHDQQYFQDHTLHALEVIYLDPADDRFCLMKYVNERFEKITITGGEDDKIKLDYAEVAIRELIQKKDTTLGIEFTLTNHARYSSLVRLFDICQKESVRSYFSYGNKFWVCNLWPKKNESSSFGFICGTVTHVASYKANSRLVISFLLTRPVFACLSLLFFAMLVSLSVNDIHKQFVRTITIG